MILKIDREKQRNHMNQKKIQNIHREEMALHQITITIIKIEIEIIKKGSHQENMIMDSNKVQPTNRSQTHLMLSRAALLINKARYIF